jgi:DinB superfamily
MSEANPYDKFLDGRPLDTILSTTADAIAEYLEVIGKGKAMAAPAPGKWSAAEIVCHLADCEIVFAFRLRQTLAEDNPTIEPFDQEKWAKVYGSIPAAAALETFTALRKWNLVLIRTALPAAAKRKMTHPERGTMTFETVVETMAGHDLNHLGQLKRIAGKPA